MRTKLLFISVIAAICGLFSISSCSKADYTAPPFDTTLIVGTWDIHHADVTAFGQTTTLSASEIYTMGQAMMGTENVQFLDATLVITETTINGEA